VRRRLSLRDPEAGVYAILYAVLCVVLLGMAAVVVDFASLRSDRRTTRAAADSASIAGAALLDSTNVASSPYGACVAAWDYLASTLRITKPSGVCSPFNGISIASYCSAPTPTMIIDDRTIDRRTYRIAWPVPTGADQGFLTPDLAPGSINQPANTATNPGTGNTDGYANGCDKLGVAIFEAGSFGLAGALGYTGTNTQVHSVARVIPQAGPEEDAAALNVLNTTQCESLVTTGNGKVTVGPVLDTSGNPVSAGIIAVEAAGTAGCNGAGSYTIDPTTGNGSRICAAATSIASGTCDGAGRILAHAMDPGAVAAKAYNPAAYPASLQPLPTAEGGIRGYIPVTKRYGCATLSNCNSPTPNFISLLVSAYGGSGMPSSTYSGTQLPMSTPAGSFTDQSSVLCPGGNGITGLVVISTPYSYANCTLNISTSGVVIVNGGTLVVNGAISNSGCLVVNTAVSTCPTTADVTDPGTAQVSTLVRPQGGAIVYIRGNGCPTNYCFHNDGTLVMPQTFVYMGGSSPLDQASTGLTLWTAPDAGVRVSGRTTLDEACYDTTATPPVVVDACVNSRFGRMTFWSEFAAPKTKPHNFAGQGALNVVGIFFTPTSYFNLTGGGGYTGAAAQFWADQLNVNGGANLGLSPFEAFSLGGFGPRIVLIR
jgi:hypothetical protein